MTLVADKELAVNNIKTALHLGAPEKDAVVLEAMLDEMINKKCDCEKKGKRKKTDGEKKERTPRQEFMSNCMTGKEKGGQGKTMKDCVIDWDITKKIGEVK